MTQDPRIDSYIADSAAFAQPILTRLRALVHESCPEVVETIRWSMPSFSYRERPLAQMAAFKQHCSFGLWNGGAMTAGGGPSDIGTPGTGDRVMARLDRLTSLDDLAPAETIMAGVRASAALIASGERPKRAARAVRPEAEIPPALAAALAQDAAAAATFAAFPQSCRREYCDWVAEAKRDATRDKRVGEAVAMLREGKRRNWKYENC